MKKNLTWLLMSMFVAGCGNDKRVEQLVTANEKSNQAVREENQRLQRKVEDLSNTVMVLQDRLETMKLAMEKRPAEPAPKVRKSAWSAKAKPSAAVDETNDGEPFLKMNDPKDSDLPPLKLSNKDLDRGATSDRIMPNSNVGQPEKSEETPEATRVYNEAFRKFEAESYASAISELDSFVHKFPNHAYADNALYWMGESFFRLNDYTNALVHFERVIKEYPSGNKVPDALLRSGDCYVRMTRMGEAHQSFEKVIQLYPRSIAAEKARAWLAQPSSQKAAKGRM